MKQTIKLKESQLRQIIHESIVNILNEEYASSFPSVHKDLKYWQDYDKAKKESDEIERLHRQQQQTGEYDPEQQFFDKSAEEWIGTKSPETNLKRFPHLPKEASTDIFGNKQEKPTDFDDLSNGSKRIRDYRNGDENLIKKIKYNDIKNKILNTEYGSVSDFLTEATNALKNRYKSFTFRVEQSRVFQTLSECITCIINIDEYYRDKPHHTLLKVNWLGKENCSFVKVEFDNGKILNREKVEWSVCDDIMYDIGGDAKMDEFNEMIQDLNDFNTKAADKEQKPQKYIPRFKR